MRLPRIVGTTLLISVILVSGSVQAGGPSQGREVTATPAVLKQRDRVDPANRMLRDRLDHLLPVLMRETGIDLWVVINREYAEDPVYLTLVPEPVFSARRTTMLVIHDRGEKGIERLTVSRYPLGEMYDPAWEGGSEEDQWKQLVKVISDRNPRTIGINTSEHWAFGDGITASLRDRLIAELPTELRDRIVGAESLAIRWLETRSAMELEVYPHVVAIARSVIAESFSNRVITPGVTTTDDVAWFIRQRFADLDVAAWFMPYVNIQRRGAVHEVEDPFFGKEGVIHRGDVLHTDVGICYLRLCTDTQEMGYVLGEGETEPPKGLRDALAAGNRWQDILTSNFRSGSTGNEILARTIAQSESENIRSSTYTHPLGFFGHAPGPTVGMWDQQGPTPVRGDWALRPNTGFAIEGNVKVRVPEWNDQWVQVKLEQSAWFNGEKVYYLAGRQTTWHVVE